MTTNKEACLGNEMSKQSVRRLGAVKIALIVLAVVAAVVLATLLFTLFGVDSVLPSDDIAAYAWSLPSGQNVGFSTVDFSDSGSLKNSGSPSNSIFTAPGGCYVYAKGKHSDKVTNQFEYGEDWRYDTYILFIWDVNMSLSNGYNSDRAAIYAGNITEFEVSVTVGECGSNFVDTDYAIYLTFFIVQLDGNGNNVGASDIKTDTAPKKTIQSRSSGTMSITPSYKAATIRYGVAVHVDVDDARQWLFGYLYPTMQVKGISASTPAVTYSTPQITVNSGNNGTIEGAGTPGVKPNGGNGYNNYSAALNKELNSVFARANPDYYFAGWTISGGTLYTNIFFDDKNTTATATGYTGSDLLTPFLHLRGGAYLKGSSLTFTAKFEQIPISSSANDFTYKQDSSFNSLGQGPSINTNTEDEDNPLKSGFSFTTGVYEYSESDPDAGHLTATPSVGSSLYYSGTSQTSYGSSSKPSDVGTYAYTIFIFRENQFTDNSTNHTLFLGYYYQRFEIKAFNIGQEGVNISDTKDKSSVNGNMLTAQYTYSSLAIRPRPQEIYAFFGSDVYKLILDTTYQITYYSDNVRATDKATMTISALGKNFSNSNTLTFRINKLELSALSVYYGDSFNNYYSLTAFDGSVATSDNVDSFNEVQNKVFSTATDIMTRYKCMYTGYQIRPNVLLVYVTATVPKDVNNPSVTCRVIFPLISGSGTTGISELYGTQASTSVTYYNLSQVSSVGSDGSGSTMIGKFGNNINASSYADAGENCANFEITVLNTGDIATSKGNTMTVFFDIAPLPLDNPDMLKQYFSSSTAVTVISQENDPAGAHTTEAEKTYNGSGLTPTVDYIYVSVSNMTINTVNSSDGSVVSISGVTVVYVAIVNNADYTISAVSNGTQIVSGEAGTFVIAQEASAFYYPALDSARTGYAATGCNSRFTVSTYGNNVNARSTGDANAPYVEASFSGNFSGVARSLFNILPKSISNNNIAFDSDTSTIQKDGIPNQTYTGKALTPAVWAYVQGNRKPEDGSYVEYTLLTSGVDYDISYSNNLNVSRDALVTVTGKGNYTGEATTTFWIIARALSDSTFKIEGFPSLEFTGTALTSYPFTGDSSIVVKALSSTLTEEYIIPYYKPGTTDPQFEISGYGKNTSVADSNGKNAYFTLNFLSTGTGLGANFSGILTAYFTITPKNIASLEGRADYDLYYTGERLKPNTTSELVVFDKDNLSVQGGYTLKHGTDFVLNADDDKYGDNINAGEGTLTVSGIGNYSGELRISFTIKPFDISGYEPSAGDDNPALITVSLDIVNTASNIVDSAGNVLGVYSNGVYSYYYKNASDNEIRPTVNAVTSDSFGRLDLLDDYSFSYGYNGADNKNVKAGGAVVISGRGNFTGDYVLYFNILQISQTVAFDNPLTKGGSSMLLESDGIGVAAYQISTEEMAATGIRVTAYTSAVSEPYVYGRFSVYTVAGYGAAPTLLNESEYNISYTYSGNQVSHNGIWMMPTTADITFKTAKSGYYVVTVSFSDANGNFADAGPDVVYNYDLHSILVKKNDGLRTEESFSADWTYGDGEVRITPQLLSVSGATVSLTVAAESRSVIEFVGGDLRNGFTLKIKSAGTAKLTLSHSGYVSNSNYQEAYFPFTLTREFAVSPKDLYVYVDGVAEAVYGSVPEFVYAYKGLVPGDEGKVLSAVDTDYGEAFHDVLPDGSGYRVATVRNTLYENGISAANYNIIYGSYRDYMLAAGLWSYDSAEYVNYFNLVVTKKVLVATASNASNAAGRITKAYGEENPTTVTFSYDGFVYGEGPDTIITDPEFVSPEVVYEYSSASGSVAINHLTGAGTYNISIREGSSSNYIIVGGAQQLVISKVRPTLYVNYTEHVYDGTAYPVKYSLVGIEGGTEPDDDNIIVIYYQTGSALYTAPYHAGRYNVSIRFIAGNDPNYTDTAIARFTSASGEVRDIDTTNGQLEGALVIHAAIPQFEYPGDSIELAYDKNGISLDNLKPIARPVKGGANPSGTITITGFRKSGSGSEYSADLIIAGQSVALLSGGTWDIRFQYESTMPDYASVGGDTHLYIVGGISIAADLVNITFQPVSATYSGNSVSITADMFKLHFPEMPDNVTVPGSEVVPGDEYGEFFFGIVPSDYSGADYEYLIDHRVTEAVNAGDYAVWAYYRPRGQEARITGIIISGAVRIARKQLKASDFVKADGSAISAGAFRYTFNATAFAPSYPDDIVLKSGVLAACDSALMGDVRITFVKSGQENLSSVINAGIYSIVFNYSPAFEDNYEMSADNTVQSALEIVPRSVTPIYDGQKIIVTYSGNGVGLTARVEGVGNISPAGKLEYSFRISGSSGEWLSSNPVNAGEYDVMISYAPTANDNYAAGEALILQGYITIQAYTPSITFGNVEIKVEDLGSFQPVGSALYALGGASGDTTPLDMQGSVTIWIGVLNQATNTRTWLLYDEWHVNYSSGTYSVRVKFSSTSANYTDNTQERHNVFVVLNATPVLEMDMIEHTYDGSSVAAVARVYRGKEECYPYDESNPTALDNVYFGSLNYEYSVAGTNRWVTTRPSNVGTYSVRVTYMPNASRDVFASATEIFENILVINPLDIYILPVYGQGQPYIGSNYNGTNLAYMYSYVENGVVYYVYSVVTDKDTGYRFDLGNAQYTDADGNVYTVYTGIDPEGDGKAERWLDYVETELKLLRGSFAYGGESYTALLEGAFEGITEQTLGGIRFIIDLDRDIVYPQSGSKGYDYETEEGVYLSRVETDGRVYVMKVDTGSANYVNGPDGTATYVTTVNGRNVLINIDYNTMRASGANVNYTVGLSAGVFSYQGEDKRTVTVYVDFANLVKFDSELNTAVYRASDGNTYLVDLGMSMAIAVSELNIETVEIDGVEIAVADMGAGELNNGYNYSYYAGDGRYYVIDIANRTLRLAKFMFVTENGTDLLLGYGSDVYYTVPTAALQKTRRENVYMYYDAISAMTFVIDLGSMIARDEDYLDGFDITRTEYYTDFMYTVYNASGTAVDRMSLFGKNLTSSAPELPGGAFTGSLSVNAYDAGEYVISVLGVGANNNFDINSYAFGGSYSVKFLVTRIPLEVVFVAPADLVYNGIAKEVTASVTGLIPGEKADIRLEYLSASSAYADNVNVTDEGFYVRASLINAEGNYYLVNNTSETYFVTPATMNAPTYDHASAVVVYDGLAHTIEIVPDEGATVEYVTATRFVEPGTYTIGANVTRGSNYYDIYFEATLVINKAVFSVSPAAYTAKLSYGDPLPQLASDTELGYIALDPDQTLMPGDLSYTWTFYPYDNASFYARYEGAEGGDIRGTITLHVEKAQAQIEIFTDLEQTETNPLAIVGAVNGNSLAAMEGVSIEYVDSSGNRYSTMPTTAGRYTVVVTYAGDELYAETVKEFMLTIEDENNLVWLYYVLGGLTVLAVFSVAFFLMKRGKKYE